MEEILRLYLQKIDKMSQRERDAFIGAIELMNQPIFTCSDDKYIKRIIPS